ncbi:MAG: hypothetical protein QOD40_330 [Alphaproteobacteria bacterium]|jgi:hypothetical protein|nr:hypothetical protein [Alphaproteobacteria bacterium]
MSKTMITAAVLSALTLSTTLAQSQQSAAAAAVKRAQVTSPKPSKQVDRNAQLTDAASINEDLIGFALDGEAGKVAEQVAAMRKSLPKLRSFLDTAVFETLGRQVTGMEQASSQNDTLGAALVAVESYRVIETAMDTGSRPSPIEVAMLDYSGFKLSVLAAMQDTDWMTITATAREADTSWLALTTSVKDASIRNLVSAIQVGLRAAVERTDIQGVKFAAKMQLEVVDVLEGYFQRNPVSGGNRH